jgi:ABC-2 type transport system permease protein
MKNNFSTTVKEIISFSREQALHLGNEYIGPEHLILGLIQQGNNRVLGKWKDLEINLPGLIAELENSVVVLAPKNIRQPSSLPLNMDAERIIRGAVAEGKAYNSSRIDPEHLLLALLRIKDLNATKILSRFTLDYDSFQAKMGIPTVTEKEGQPTGLKPDQSVLRTRGLRKIDRDGGFGQIFIFEIKYRLKRPDTYLYFSAFFLFAFLGFANGAVPTPDRVSVNSGLTLTIYFSIMSLFMMVVTGPIMGSPIYRDLEYNTHEYYLAFPITQNGYFWGRFLGSFLFVAVIGSSLIFGSFLGTLFGRAVGWLDPSRIGAFHLPNYIRPYFFFLIPNLLLTSAVFFGLVAITRNVKVIYTGGVIFYLLYMIALFVFHSVNNKNIIYYLDAFGFNPLQLQSGFLSPAQKNGIGVPIQGLLLVNRLIWSGVGLVILFFTWYRFNFVRFFSGGRGRKNVGISPVKIAGVHKKIPIMTPRFSKNYRRNVLYTLSKIELLSVLRDNYFRLILLVGIFFLGVIFWNGNGSNFGVWNLPTTVFFMNMYDHDFLLFVFLILLFYTGEAVHREKASRFAIINDALPPANWMLYGSKMIALFCLSGVLASVPMFVGLAVQLIKGYHDFNFPIYLTACYAISMPLFTEMILFAFGVHVLINNKFAGHAVGLIIWIMLLLANSTGHFDYNLLLYSYTPSYAFSDLDGLSPSALALFWFHCYWLLCGGLLLILGAVFYYRGIISSFKERIRLARHRFTGPIRLLAISLALGFVLVGAYNYYNVSYLHEYLTYKEKIKRAVAFEKILKKFQKDPLPNITKIRLFTDLYPDQRKAVTKAFISIKNNTGLPISRILLDGDQLSSYSVKCRGLNMPFSYPLIYPRAIFSLFKPSCDTSMYRLYQFVQPLAPGDSAILELDAMRDNIGFSNEPTDHSLLHNGTVFDGGFPGLGYDDDEELRNPQKRKEFQLPPQEEEFPSQEDSAAKNSLIFSNISGLLSFETTISTSGDQIAIAPGNLEGYWQQNGRNYFHYRLDSPRTYFSFGEFSGRYAITRDSVKLPSGQSIGIEIYYHPGDARNLGRFMSAYKDGIPYLSKNFGSYQFKQMRLIESTLYTGRYHNFPNTSTFGEEYGWIASFDEPGLFDFCYFMSAFQLGQQWWMFQVAPNHAQGSNVIAEGLAKYGAIALYEKKVGEENMKNFLNGETNYYLNWHRYAFEKEFPLLNSKRDFVWDTKAGVILYELKDLIGEDSLNLALHEFRDAWAYRDKGPYAGGNDLYRYIQKHVPDSLKYYLIDSWEKITIYDNKILAATVKPIGKNDEYQVHVRLSVGKTYTDSAGEDRPVQEMNDLIDIGVFGSGNHPMYLKKHWFIAGEHDLNIVVKGKPLRVGIDPLGKLIDRQIGDNYKNF